MTDADRATERLYHRIHRLPSQLDRARRRVTQLEAEMQRYGMRT